MRLKHGFNKEQTLTLVGEDGRGSVSRPLDPNPKPDELRFGENETLNKLDGPEKFSPPPSLPPHAGWSTRRRFADAREEMS